MKKQIIAMLAVVAVAGGVVQAQTNSFTVSVKGTITQRNGTKIKVGDVGGSKGFSQLVSTNTNILVLTADENNNSFALDEVKPGATNSIVNRIWLSYAVAITAAGNACNSGSFKP